MFVDASAIIAILTDEPEAEHLAETLQAFKAHVTSPNAIYEAVLGLARKLSCSLTQASTHVTAFLALFSIETMPINSEDARTALIAFEKFGKGRRHPAQLNMGDCFAYAAAKNSSRELLFKGDDFSQTDIGIAGRNTAIF